MSHVRRRLDGILGSISDGLCAYDREWRYVYLNPQGERYMQRSADDLIGRVVWDVFPGAIGSQSWHEYHRAQREQIPITYEELDRETGLWFEQHLFPSPEGLTVWARDITARRSEEAQRAALIAQSEKRFRALIENGADGIMTVTADGLTIYASPSCERVDGFTPEERVGTSVLAAAHPTDSARITADFHGVAGTPHGRITGQQYRVWHKHGRWMWIEVSAQNLLDDPAVRGIVINFRDVTQRREAADAYVRAKRDVERSERHYRALIDNGNDLISILDANGVYRYASPSHERVLGWPLDELIGKSAFELVHPDDLARVAQAFQDGIETRSSGTRAIFRYRHRDGSWYWLEVIGSIPDREAGLDGYVFNARDVSERVSAQQRTQILLDTTRDIGATLDAAELLERVQRHVARVLPCDAVATFQRDPLDGVFRLVAHTEIPDDALGVFRGLEMAEGSFTGDHLQAGTLVVNEIERFPWQRSVDTGSSVVVSAVMAAPLRIRGSHAVSLVAFSFTPGRRFESDESELFTGIADQLAVALERVELYRTEQEAAEVSGALARVGQELLESFDTPRLLDRLCHVTTDVLGCQASHTLLWQKEEEAYVPVAAHGVGAEEWEAMRVLKLSHEAVTGRLERTGGETLLRFVAGASETGVVAILGLPAGTPVLCLALRRGEEIIGFQTAAMPSGGRPFSEVSLRIARGIAHIGSMALEHARINDQLGRANNLKSEFVAMMSHELRTPLNPIIGYGDLLLEEGFGPINDQQRDALQRMQRSSHNLLKLINEILDLSRLESGRISLDLAALDIAPLLAAIDAETVELRRPSGVALRIDVPPELPRITTDAAKLKVVLKNLVVNALKFTSHGSVTVSVRSRDGGLAIDVRDTGIGIPPQSSEMIFEPFRQAEGAELRPQGGVGLGLYIVRRLVDVLRGQVSVESVVGAGSTFRVWIPDASSDADARTGPRVALAAHEANVAVIRRDGTILAVNDGWRSAGAGAAAGASSSELLDVGANYFAACADASEPEALTALEARVGIQSVSDGTRERFSLEYRGPAPQQDRWFLMTAVPYPGNPGDVLVMHSDVTAHRQMQEAAARRLPTDPLTGLPNQQFFRHQLEVALSRAQRTGTQVGLLYLDLDHFKHVNTKLGRACGDQVLQLTARRLQEVLHAHEVVSRPGGDEFLVLVPSVSGASELFSVATRVLSAFALPFNVESKAIQLQASIGLALAPDDASDAETLLQCADIALSEAKRASRGGAVRHASERIVAVAAVS